MKHYKLVLNNIEVTEFNEEYGDWSGESFSKGGDVLNPVFFDKLNIKNLIEAIESITYIEVNKEELFFCDNRISCAQIEDANACPDPNGKYLVDYDFTVTLETIEDVDVESILG